MGKVSGSHSKKRKWTKHEDEALISTLTELCQTGWKRYNNSFKSGYTTILEKELKLKIPGSNLKATPHIESRLKTLKKHWEAITDMKDAFGIEWRTTDSTLLCYDDDVWEDWIKDHPDAKGLRNKPFPYYEELCLIYGKSRSNNQKSVEDASDVNRDVETYETNDSDHEDENDHKSNDHMNGNEDEVSVDEDVIRSTPPREENKKGQNQTGQSSRSWSTGMEGLVKIIETLVKRHDEQFSLLAGIVGREVAADKAAADKRAKLNGELKRIPNLGLQARLRAASMIVCDPAKIDLFYSLSFEERKEWVSMLLSGLI